MDTKVLNKRTAGVPAGAVYVGRPTKWGNPFKMARESDRALVLMRYFEWLTAQPELVAAARAELAGKDLVCWCAPLNCHADILMAVANAPAVTS